MELDVKRSVDDRDRVAINSLLDAATAADRHHPLSDHAWLDLVDGGRPGFAALLGWQPDHDHPVGYAQLSRADSGSNWSIDLVIHPHHRFDGAEIGRTLLGRALGIVEGEGGGHVHLWVSHPNEAHDRLAVDLGLTRGRDLMQLRRPLPVGEPFALETRPFEVGQDEQMWLEVNNRAFDWHPEQGGWTLETLERREKEPWFDPEGFLLHERDGMLAGFCWTKIHDATAFEPVLGEIYVIAVNPDFQGLGLGRGLTLAGLGSLHRRGVEYGMLYVDAANTAAVALYERLGFTVDHIDRAYTADLPSSRSAEIEG